MSNSLQRLGLTEWEIQVYKALLAFGQSTTGPLISNSKVPSSKIYYVLEQLVNKGLVTHISIGKVKHFQAQPPQRLIELLEQNKDELLEDIAKFSVKPVKSSTEIFEGLKAIRVMHQALIYTAKKGESYYGYSQGGKYPKEISVLYAWMGEQRRIKGLKDHLLISKQNKAIFEASILKDQLAYVRKKTRYAVVPFPADTAIFGDSVIIFDYDEVPKAILISDASIAKAYTEFFLDCWKKAK